MALLAFARALVSWVPFHLWRDCLGYAGRGGDALHDEAAALAADVRWAAKRLPFESKCLPQAMALSWMLSRNEIGHAVIFAVRRGKSQNSPDLLHCWVEIEGRRIIGELEGKWAETLRLEGQSPIAPANAH
jgi:Transglutaminase-like superfamily